VTCDEMYCVMAGCQINCVCGEISGRDATDSARRATAALSRTRAVRKQKAKARLGRQNCAGPASAFVGFSNLANVRFSRRALASEVPVPMDQRELLLGGGCARVRRVIVFFGDGYSGFLRKRAVRACWTSP